MNYELFLDQPQETLGQLVGEIGKEIRKVEKEKVVLFNADKCTGCRLCELACSIFHQGEYNPKKSFIRIMANEEAEVYIPVIDIHCDFCGKCVNACAEVALKIVTLNEGIGAMKGATMGSFPAPVYSIAGK